MTTMVEDEREEFRWDDATERWVPLCGECGADLEYQGRNSQTPWQCWQTWKHSTGLAYRALIWADEWPDYVDEDDDDDE